MTIDILYRYINNSLFILFILTMGIATLLASEVPEEQKNSFLIKTQLQFTDTLANTSNNYCNFLNDSTCLKKTQCIKDQQICISYFLPSTYTYKPTPIANTPPGIDLLKAKNKMRMLAMQLGETLNQIPDKSELADNPLLTANNTQFTPAYEQQRQNSPQQNDVRIIDGQLYVNNIPTNSNYQHVVSKASYGTNQVAVNNYQELLSYTSTVPSYNYYNEMEVTKTGVWTDTLQVRLSSKGSPKSGSGLQKVLLTDVYEEHIPCDAHYDHNWDNKNIHAYKYDLTQMPDTVEFLLTHGLADDFYMPIGNNVRVTSNFGPRGRRHHNGIDLGLRTGEPIRSTFKGRVRIAQYSRSYGYVVVVRHFNGLETLYAHLSKLKVAEGDLVQAGDVIGLGGNTGRSTGAHLHMEVRYKGHPLDPNEMIDFAAGNLRNHTFTVDRSYFSSSTPYQSSHSNHNHKHVSANTSSKNYHIVRRGDTLSGIASRYGKSLSNLYRLNGLSSKSTLNVGQKIKLR